jgi:hypothetical protein
MLETPPLTRTRVGLAYGVAAVVDVLQFSLGPLGWAFADEILDVAAMLVMWRVIGFHPLLLPTFVLEILPIADVLPLWTGCVALVVALRRKQQGSVQRTPGPPAPGPIIDV